MHTDKERRLIAIIVALAILLCIALGACLHLVNKKLKIITVYPFFNNSKEETEPTTEPTLETTEPIVETTVPVETTEPAPAPTERPHREPPRETQPKETEPVETEPVETEPEEEDSGSSSDYDNVTDWD